MALSVFERASSKTAVGFGSLSRKRVSLLVGEEGGWREPLLELAALLGVPAPEPDPGLPCGWSVAILSIGCPNIPTACSVEEQS